jgi:integrase/recombinase XerD
MKPIQGITMSECTVQLWYNKQRVKKGDHVSLYLEIIVARQHKPIKLKNLKWPVNKFDWDNKKLLPRFKNDPDLVTYNAIIERERGKYWSVIMNFVKEDRQFVLADILKGANLFRTGTNFCDFMAQAIIDRQKTKVKKDMIKGTTAEKHSGTMRKFLEYLKNKDIAITRIDSNILEGFADHLRKKVSENTVWMRIQQTKSYLSYAERNGVAINSDYKKFIILPDESDPTWLEEFEIQRLLKLYDEGTLGSVLQNDLRAFLFATFTGLRISDLSRWNKSWIKKDVISFIPTKKRKSAKAPKPLIIPIIPIASEFIKDLVADSFKIPSADKYNKGLKRIAVIAGIEKDITSHVARHTFATWLAIEGVPIMVISQLLGHKSVKTTMIYIHIAERYLAVEAMRLQIRFARKTIRKNGVNAPILAKKHNERTYKPV